MSTSNEEKATQVVPTMLSQPAMFAAASNNIAPKCIDENTIQKSIDPEEQSYAKDIAHSISEKWEKFKDNDDSMEELASNLYREINRILDSHNNNTSKKSNVIEYGIKIFLMEEKGIDDCILWTILHNAVKKFRPVPSKKGESADYRIIRIILDEAPHLSFEEPTKKMDQISSWNPESIERRCNHQPKHSLLIAPETTPFHDAAEKAYSDIVAYMLSRGENILANTGGHLNRADFIQVLRLPKPHSSHILSALSLSAMRDERGLETVKALLKYDPQVAINPTDDTFVKSLKGGKHIIVDAFLEYKSLRDEFITAENILKALEVVEKSITDGKTPAEEQLTVVRTLISHAQSPKQINDDVVKKIIELDLIDAWEQRNKEIELDISGFLHIAVQCQNAKFVKMFLEENPGAVFEKKDLEKKDLEKKDSEKKDSEKKDSEKKGKYALWYNNKLVSGESRSKDALGSQANRDIREMLVTKIIKGRSTSNMQDLLKIFRDSEEPVKELCFDLSRFNSKKYPVSDFVRSLINHQDNPSLLSYEHTLKYAEFPNLDAKTDEKEIFGDSVHYEHAEVYRILKWLREIKGVREIIELTVPDRLVNPHNEVKIGEYVSTFKVQVLNWRFLDLSITILPDDESMERITELHLYASGKRAAISHWTSEKGILQLPNLTRLEIHVVQDLMTKEQCSSTVHFIKEEFKPVVKRINAKRRNDQVKLRVNCKSDSWNPAQMRLADLEEISERAVPKLSRFIKSYRDYVHDLRAHNEYPFRPIKVALIDNGVLSISPLAGNLWDPPTHTSALDRLPNNVTPRISRVIHQGEDSIGFTHEAKPDVTSEAENHRTLWSRIKDGQSFVEESSRVSPWLFASNPHGTQMANLICAIDPWCDLYVAKVTEGRAGILPARVARAIRWAIDKNVDIISMSFAISEKIEELEDACSAAYAQGIVLLCSTHDEGLAVSDTYPASFHNTITITACDDYGKVLRPGPQGATSSFSYKVQGQSVAAGVIPFLDSDDYISGSSVATAITAGLSSLILSCNRIAKDNPEHPDSKKGTPKSLPYETRKKYRETIVKKHLNEMLAKESKDYILLENFARIDMKVQDGLDIEASEIITKYFQQPKFNED
ncbi:hypothetical protein Trisim1_010012 [Trichoderma cf. simile WF8]